MCWTTKIIRNGGAGRALGNTDGSSMHLKRKAESKEFSTQCKEISYSEPAMR